MLLLLAALAHAGLGPDDVVVLYNADDTEATATAAYYAEARDIDPAHLCGLTGIDPATRGISAADAELLVVTPLEACRAALPHPEDIDVIVTVRGLPYTVAVPGGTVSLDAYLQVGRATYRDGSGLIAGSRNDFFRSPVRNPVYIEGGAFSSDMTASYGPSSYYATSPRIARGLGVPAPFERVADRWWRDWDFTDELLIVSRLDGFDHDDARDLVDRAIAADQSFPAAPFLCMRGSEGARGVRDAECEHALRMLDSAGFDTTWVDTFDAELSGHEVITYWTGTANLKTGIDGITYAPGAVADNITSFGARPQNFFCNEAGDVCPESESQTSVARFVRAGATGAHGTVAEPYNNCFPNAGFMLLYAHGYTMGEAWLTNQQFLYWMHQYLGDPLTLPFADRPQITALAEAAVDAPWRPEITHPWGIASVTVYVDGAKVHTDADGSFQPDGLGLADGDTVDVLVVAQADAAPAIEVAGWPALEPVTFDPGPKGWLRTTLSVGPPVPVDEPEPEAGCGCSSGASEASLFGWLPLVVIVSRRRRSR